MIQIVERWSRVLIDCMTTRTVNVRDTEYHPGFNLVHFTWQSPLNIRRVHDDSLSVQFSKPPATICGGSLSCSVTMTLAQLSLLVYWMMVSESSIGIQTPLHRQKEQSQGAPGADFTSKPNIILVRNECDIP